MAGNNIKKFTKKITGVFKEKDAPLFVDKPSDQEDEVIENRGNVSVDNPESTSKSKSVKKDIKMAFKGMKEDIKNTLKQARKKITKSTNSPTPNKTSKNNKTELGD